MLSKLDAMDRTRIEDTTSILSCSWAKGGSNTKPESCTNVYITGCDPLWKENDVLEFFSHFGEISSVAMMNPRGNEQHTNSIAFVKYCSSQAAEMCVEEANGIRLPTMNIPLSVRFSKHQKF